MHLGTNHLGHVAATGLLLLSRAGGRVVSVGRSIAARGKIDFEDLPANRRYQCFASYARSKLANLMFALELGHRAKDGKAGLASHPGASSSSLLTGKERDRGPQAPAQRSHLGPHPGTGRAAASARCPGYALRGDRAGLTGGEYIGPGGRAHLRGAPQEVAIPEAALDPAVRLTGADYAALT